MVILYFLRWFNIILFLRFLFQTGRLCTKLGFFIYYYLPYCYLHQTQENENVRSIKEGKIILKIALRLWSYVLDFLFSNPIVWSYIFRRIYLLPWIAWIAERDWICTDNDAMWSFNAIIILLWFLVFVVLNKL